MTDYSFQTLHSDGGARVIFRGVVGSRAYGTDRPGSDEDVRGVFLVPPLEYALLAAPPEQVADERNDRVYYSLRRFAELAASSNPNALELFWLPPDCVRLDTPRFARLRENRKLFLSRRAVDTHIGYALAQIKKARGCNKRDEKRAKNMMHLVRLLLSGRNLVRNGEPIVRFEGEERERLLSIRDGAWSFDDIMALADSLQADIRAGLDACPLPPEPDFASIDNLLRELQPPPSRSVSGGIGTIGGRSPQKENSDLSNGSANASPEILAALRAQEEERGVRILYAAESGSRAWGFASPDSDWDVRAIYVHPLDWYLRVAEKPSDTFEAMRPGDIDLSAWELRKALRLFAKSNVPLLEWLGSPIVYLDRDNFGDRLRALVPRFFDPRGAAWHHLAMQRSALADLAPDGTIRIKKLCYALRSALSVRWIVARTSMPPVPFPELFAASDLDPAVRASIDDIIAAKRGASERDRTALPPVLASLFAENESVVPAAEFPKKERSDLGQLDAILRLSVLS